MVVILVKVMSIFLFTSYILKDLIATNFYNGNIGLVFVQEISQTVTASNDASGSYIYSSSTSSPETSESVYNPGTLNESKRKKVMRKGKCDGTGKCNAKASDCIVVSLTLAF
jgi:hypothetical protein